MKKKIVLTFDDTPVGTSAVFNGEERLNHIVSTLRSFNARAAFFVCTEKINPDNFLHLEYLDEQGQFIGNHSYGHYNTMDIGVDEYINNIIKADGILSKYKTFKKWYRYPFLDEGNSSKTNKSIAEGLLKLGYANYYITVPTYDFYLDMLLQQSLQAKPLLDIKPLIALYLTVIIDSITFYDRLAEKLLGRTPTHILLLHENDISALGLPYLIEKLQSNNWEIMSPDNGIDSELANYTAKTFPVRLGRITQIAQDRGVAKRFARTIDEQYLQNLWQSCL